MNRTATTLKAASARHDTIAQVSCSTCPPQRNCCQSLDRIWLTQNEYDRLFADHEDLLKVERRATFLMVHRVDGGACPHWSGAGCGVYEDRPIECRLFPHTLSHIETTSTSVDVHVHAATQCPAGRTLIHPEATVTAMCEAFIEDSSLAGRRVRVHSHGQSALMARARTVMVRGWRRIVERERLVRA